MKIVALAFVISLAFAAIPALTLTTTALTPTDTDKKNCAAVISYTKSADTQNDIASPGTAADANNEPNDVLLISKGDFI